MPKGTAKPQRIMRAVERLFKNRRVHEITLDEVARAAGVGKGTIYVHFRDKDDLFFRTATAGFDDLCATLSGSVPRQGTFPDRLLSACMAIDAFFGSRRQLLRMMQTEEGRMFWLRGAMHSQFVAHHRKLIGILAEIVRTGLTEGTLGSRLSPEALAQLLLGMCHARAQLTAEVAGEPPTCHDLVRLFCQGAAAASRGPT